MSATAIRQFDISGPGLAQAMAFLETLAALWGAPVGTARALCVILDETVGNLMLHDDSIGAWHPFTVALTRVPGGVVLTISDPGAPFDPTTQAPDPTRELGGLGLVLTRGLARDIRYVRQGDANHLTVWVDDRA